MSFRDWTLSLGLFCVAIGVGLFAGSLLSAPAGVGAGLAVAGAVLEFVGIWGLPPIGKPRGET